MYKYLVVGAGFSGAVLARELAAKEDARILIVDERSHLGGNCHTERDNWSGVMVHRYGPHIFNTDSIEVWNYVQQFGRFHPFTNRVKAKTHRGVFSMPINLLTINQFFGKAMSPGEAAEFVANLGDRTIIAPRNFEELALKLVGRDLYEAFFYGYTKKQWGCEPREISSSVLSRLPIRFNYDDNYYNARFQGIPEEGYTVVISRILDHPNIEVKLGESFSQGGDGFEHVFYTGPLDAYFHHQLGRLGYRTVTFERVDAQGDFQGNAVINYTEASVPYTRIHEHKHFAPWETHERTVAFREFSKATEPSDVPYYPIPREADKELLRKYYDLAHGEERISFLGRLGTYRYLDMDDVIEEALHFSRAWLKHRADPAMNPAPKFSHDPFAVSGAVEAAV